MRVLEFEVKGQRLLKKRSCNFSGLVAGSIGYLQAKFDFSEEWSDCTIKIARFWLGEEEHAMTLDENNTCQIPDKVLKSESFDVSVLGACPSYRIKTNKTKIRQEAS